MTTKTYIEFRYPGLIFSNTESVEIKHRNPDDVDVPAGAYAFRFFDKTEVEIDGETLIGEPKNHSGICFVEGKIETIDQVAVSDPGSILLQNMRVNKWASVINTRAGTFIFKDGDVVLRASP